MTAAGTCWIEDTCTGSGPVRAQRSLEMQGLEGGGSSGTMVGSKRRRSEAWWTEVSIIRTFVSHWAAIGAPAGAVWGDVPWNESPVMSDSCMRPCLWTSP